ncbi:MAG: cysteine--tRNA ligase [Deltaproteobacteria bacterium]|nr:cysteine--tRNA ligase [Deltaproteobacteria bacterium]
MPIKFYNTATRKKEDFITIKEGKVGLYVCGVTVYDLCHIGHARSTIVFDVLYRYLQARGFDVTHVRNFTDIDDKIIERARQLEKTPEDLAREFIEAFYEDMGALGVLNADVEPKATEHIDHMIKMIKTLIDKGFAYVEEGDVFYSIEKFEDYGGLSGRRLEDMRAGSRVAVDEKKRHPMDFVLWKGAKPGEPQWPSPWGPGRPGWHLECSVMSNHYLGPTFDIHGGGEDLVFPHHENERAQSMAANDAPFARYWIHNGFVTVESEKMSKSLGNFLTIRDALKSYHPQVLRLFLLSKHYRSPLDFSKKDVLSLQTGLVRIYRTLERLESLIGPFQKEDVPHAGALSDEQSVPFLKEFIQFMDDDLNTAGALGLVFEKVKEMNRLMDTHDDNPPEDMLSRLEEERRHLLSAAHVLGFLEEGPKSFFVGLSNYSETVDEDEIEGLIEERITARAEKDWAKADAIRDRLDAMGIILEDGPQGTTWRVKVS